MTQEKSRSQEQDAATVSRDLRLKKEAIDEVVAEYEKSAKDDTKELDIPTQKELGNVERVLEDSLLDIEDAS